MAIPTADEVRAAARDLRDQLLARPRDDDTWRQALAWYEAAIRLGKWPAQCGKDE
jgi:hypothetical protein